MKQKKQKSNLSLAQQVTHSPVPETVRGERKRWMCTDEHRCAGTSHGTWLALSPLPPVSEQVERGPRTLLKTAENGFE